MKSILHLFRSSQFTEDYVTTVNKYAKNSMHFFLIFENFFLPEDYCYLFADNIRYMPTIVYELQKPNIIKYFDSFDKIIYHGVFEINIMKFFFYNSQLLNKLYLYFWGGDIPFLETTEENNIKKKIISEAKGIVTIIESDQEKIDQLYKPIGKKYCMQYCAGNQIQDMKKYLYPHKKKYIDKEILIQVGNSATSTNNHIDILKILEKYKKENIKIFLPLAYGDQEYAEKIITYAKNIFGTKVLVQRNMLKMDEYIKEIKKVDIGIFAMTRQQALGNIFMLGMNGAKLYMNRDGQNYKYLTEKLNCSISYIDEINQMDFNSFISISESARMNNYEQILKINETDYKMKKWNDFFEA